MAHFSRREFVKTGLAAGALVSVGALPLKANRPTATDMVTLGKSDVKVTLISRVFHGPRRDRLLAIR